MSKQPHHDNQRPDPVERTASGFPSPAADYVESALDLSNYLVRNPVATFFVRATTRSMVDALIFPGDVVVVDRSIREGDGRIVVVAYDGQLMVRRLGAAGSRPALLSDNAREASQYPPIVINPELDFVQWGVVTGTARKL